MRFTFQYLESLSVLDLSLLLLDEFVTYPLPPAQVALIPFNYCALGKQLPQLAPLLALVC